MFAVCGILFNHESERRAIQFVTRKVTRAVARIAQEIEEEKKILTPLVVGNLYSKRDWGHAMDYVEAMWLMLQQDRPRDYVIATGYTHSVKEFIEEAFNVIGIVIEWEGEGLSEVGKYQGQVIIHVSEAHFRPTEVDLLMGDSSQAFRQLNWKPKITFKDLVKRMVHHDILLTQRNHTG